MRVRGRTSAGEKGKRGSGYTLDEGGFLGKLAAVVCAPLTLYSKQVS